MAASSHTSIPMDPRIDECPHCGSPAFYMRLQVSGTVIEVHRFDGEPVDNTGMWDSVQTRQHPSIYCYDCDERIAAAG